MPVNVQCIVRSDGHRMFAVLVCVSLGRGILGGRVGGGGKGWGRGEGKAKADLCAASGVLN